MAQFRKRREREQVAAVCYRIGRDGVEFLLVQTRGGRWTFPKGGTEPGLTHAQAAAMEAFEEAGVHGRMEEDSFARYIRRRRKRRSVGELATKKLAVHVHLCEVLQLEQPQEAKRKPTWFSAEEAKHRLRKDRAPGDAAELVRVVDCALHRIQQPNGHFAAYSERFPKDSLQKVQFEAPPHTGAHGRIEQASFVRYIRRQRGQVGPSTAIELAVNPYLCKVLRVGRPQEPVRVAERTAPHFRRLTAGDVSGNAPPKNPVIEFDNARRTAGRVKDLRAKEDR